MWRLLRSNDHNHRVAASDVDFRFGPDGNSGALFCYVAFGQNELNILFHNWSIEIELWAW
jgi:hypothetical protein